MIALTTAFNWRVSFVVVGAIGLLWSLLWLAFFRVWPQPALRQEPTAAAPAAPRAINDPSTVRGILSSRRWWLLLVTTCFLNPLQYFYVSWLPRYFDAYAGAGFGRELAGRLIFVYLTLDAGLVLGGAGAAVLASRLGVIGARQLVATIGALCMMIVPLASRTQSLDAITGVMCLATFGLGAFMANYLAFSSEVSTTRVSAVTGMLGGAGALSGALFMWIVGDTVAGSGGFGAAFWMAGCMPLVALTGLLFATWTNEVADSPRPSVVLSTGDPS